MVRSSISNRCSIASQRDGSRLNYRWEVGMRGGGSKRGEWPISHLHAGSPTVSKNRQVPPFMQKSPVIGHGCSCLGHAAVAATNQRKIIVSPSFEKLYAHNSRPRPSRVPSSRQRSPRVLSVHKSRGGSSFVRKKVEHSRVRAPGVRGPEARPCIFISIAGLAPGLVFGMQIGSGC